MQQVPPALVQVPNGNCGVSGQHTGKNDEQEPPPWPIGQQVKELGLQVLEEPVPGEDSKASSQHFG